MVSRRDVLRAGALGVAGAIAIGSGLESAAVAASAASSPPGSAEVSPGALKELRKKLTGSLLLPGDKGYDASSTPANGRYRGIRPLAVAVCANEADVVTCVKWVRQNGVSPVGRGGGHSYAGFSTTPGLLINLSRLNRVAIDRKSGTVASGGAALNNDFYNATKDGPLFLPGGTCLGVGVGGLALGGGIGYQTHWAGLTSDHMQSSRIVTASGEVLDLDAKDNSDLFWACRGGAGGSFGINTAFSFKLVEVPSEVTWYRYDWQGADAAIAVLNAFDNLIYKAPAALNAVAAATAVPLAGKSPSQAIDVFSRGQYIGPADELHDLVQPLLAAAGTPVKAVFQKMSFWEVVAMISSTEPPSHGFGDVSRYASVPIPESAVTAIVDLLVDCPSRSDDDNGSIWSLGWVGGSVVDSVKRTDTAYVHRGMSTLLRPTTVWSDDAAPSVGQDLNAWTNSVIAAIEPYTPDESYQNFPNRMISDWQKQYYAENFARLVQVKTKYDPDNLFHNQQSIPTATSAT
jgi:FAD/FMN-containing dehydrogenase